MSIPTSIDNPYEIDIKKLILQNPNTFDSYDDNAKIIFEKALPQHQVIADALIFDHTRGLIGIEIKTEHDSTKRLNKQLRAYEHIADETWVLIHDSQYEKVMKVLNTNNHDEVGIVCYSSFQGKIILAPVRIPRVSPHFRPKDILRMLWKNELIVIANAVTDTNNEIIRNMAYNMSRARDPEFMHQSRGNRDGHSNIQSYRMNKEQLISNIVARLGLLGAHQLIVDMFINQIKHPDKVLTYYHFSKG